MINDLDFIVDRGTAWIVDRDKLLERFTDEELRHGIPEIRLSRKLRPDEYEGCSAYSLAAGWGVGNEILPFIKGVDGMPYLPGSSVKGALRSVVAWSASLERELAPTGQELGQSNKYAASRWERRVFGRDPNHDLMRALLVDDSPPMPIERLQLTQVAVYSVKGAELAKKGPGFTFAVEALKPGTVITCRVGISEELLSHPALGFGRVRGWIDKLCKLGREKAKETIAREQGFYRQCRMHALTQFYARLEGIASDLAENQLLLQMAWGSGWVAKAIGKSLSEVDLLGDVRQRYRLGRQGAIFPKSRRLVERGGAAVEPLGWVKVTL